MSRLIFTAIGKLVDPHRPESVEVKAIDDPDYVFRVAIIPEHLMCYEEWFENPDHLYYKHKGPFTSIKYTTGNERMLICSFEEFDQKYQQAMKGLLTHKEN